MDTALLINSRPALALDRPAAGIVSRELQRLWFSLAEKSWSALLIVPAPGVAGALAIATGLLHISRRAGLEPSASVIDATHTSLEQAAGLVNQLATRLAQGERALVAIDRLDDNPAALPLVARCDAALLCLTKGRSNLGSTRRTIERCGRQRFLGSVLLVPGRGR
jgi:hypothetical protein